MITKTRFARPRQLSETQTHLRPKSPKITHTNKIAPKLACVAQCNQDMGSDVILSFLVNLFLIKLVRISGFSSLFSAIAVF